METSTVLGGIGLTLSLCGILYTAINHRRIRLKLCNRRYDFSIDVDTTDSATPNEEKKKEDAQKLENDVKVHPIKT